MVLSLVAATPHAVLILVHAISAFQEDHLHGDVLLLTFTALSWILSCVCFRHTAFMMIEVLHVFHAHVAIIRAFTNLSEREGAFDFHTTAGIQRWFRIREISRKLNTGRLRALEVFPSSFFFLLVLFLTDQGCYSLQHSTAVIFLVTFTLTVCVFMFFSNNRLKIDLHGVRALVDIVFTGLFSLLVINFGSEYHMTLKKHRRIVKAKALAISLSGYEANRECLEVLSLLEKLLEDTSTPIYVLFFPLSYDLLQKVLMTLTTLALTFAYKSISFGGEKADVAQACQVS